MVTFHPMTETEFEAFLQMSYDSFADDLLREEPLMTREAALQEARSEVGELLPKGLKTPAQYLLTIFNEENTAVGYLWYDLMGRSKAFIDDFYIFPEYRRKGYALSALKVLEEFLKGQKIPHITLHVFENNTAARCLYEKAGLEYVQMERAQKGSLYMFKRI